MLVFAPQANADIVCAMEDVLDVYQRSYAEDEVRGCMDETSKQQVQQTRCPSARGNRQGLIMNMPVTASAICSWWLRRLRAGGMSRLPLVHVRHDLAELAHHRPIHRERAAA